MLLCLFEGTMIVKYTKKDEYGEIIREYELVGLEFQDGIPYDHPITGRRFIIPTMDCWKSKVVEGIDVYSGQGTEYDWGCYKLYVALHEIEPGVVIPFYTGLTDNLTRRTKISTYTPDPSTMKLKGKEFADWYGIKLIDVLLHDIGKHPKVKKKGGKYRSPTAEKIEAEYIRNLSCKYDLTNTQHNIPHRQRKPNSTEKKLLMENSVIRKKNMSHGISARELHEIACSKKVELLKEEPISLMRFVT